jgi:hypothetical protein
MGKWLLLNMKFLRPLLIASALAPFCMAIAYAAAGAGHGSYFFAKVFFPYTMVSAMLISEITKALVALTMLQFPIYGLAFGMANIYGRSRFAVICIALMHAAAMAICFFISSDTF